jgi:hypothetical protein
MTTIATLVGMLQVRSFRLRRKWSKHLTPNPEKSTAVDFDVFTLSYEGRLKSSWTQFITPSRNFVEVRWRSTSRGKRCTSYNAPPTSRKCAADRLPQASAG